MFFMWSELLVYHNSAKSDVVHRLKHDFVVLVPHNVEEMEDAIHRILNRNSEPMFVLDVGGIVFVLLLQRVIQ